MALQDRVVDALWLCFRAALRVHYRSVDVAGAHHVPPSGPVLLVANHLNAFVDPLFVQYGMDRRVTVTAKSTLVRHPLVGPLMRAARAIALHRKQDAGDDASRGTPARDLETCRRRLAEGAALCFFPEAASHNEPRLRPFKHGAARVALDFVRDDGDPGGLVIVPVGLNYEAKGRLRSRVLVRYGEPFEVARWLAAHPEADHVALTREIEARVGELVVEFEDAESASLMRWMARLDAAMERTGHAAFDLREVEYTALLRAAARLRDRDTRQRHGHPAAAATRRARAQAYRTRLRGLGIAPEDVFATTPRTVDVARFIARELVVLLPALPFAAWGVAHNTLPALAVGAITRRMSKLRDVSASNMIFAGLLVFPLGYALQAAAVSRRRPALRVARDIVAWPLAGYAAVRMGDRLVRVARSVRVLGAYARDPALRDALVAEARAVVADARGDTSETS